MPITPINYGAAPDDGTGDPLRTAFKKTDDSLKALNSEKASETSVAEALGNKVDKVSGKGLSDENFSLTEKEKLAGVSAGATANSSDSYLRNRANHTGTQLASTISDFSAASLIEMQKFGLGKSTSPTVTDINALRDSGFYTATVAASAAAGLPLSTLGHIIMHAAGSAGSAMQFANPITTGSGNRWRVWHRQMIGDAWGGWREFAFLDSANTWAAPQVFRDSGNLPIQIVSATGDLCGYIKPALSSGSLGLRTVDSSPTSAVLDIDGENGKTLQIRIGRATNVGANIAQLIGYVHDGSGTANFLVDFKTGALRAKGAYDLTNAGAPNVFVDSAGNLLRSTSNATIYEEGSWTPILFGTSTAGTPTYITNAGKYTRVGNLCYVSGRMSISNKGGMTGSLRISGLPFIVMPGAVEANASVALGYLTGLTLPTDALGISAFAVTGANRLEFYLMRTASAGSRGLIDTDIGNGFTVYFSAVYGV